MYQSEVAIMAPRDIGAAGGRSDMESWGHWSIAGSDSAKSSAKSPFSGLAFLKNLTGEKKTRDGQPAKKRGPKPDSKPALTRRQELNRQAQRTHRERKEMYIRALEQEVLNLRETFTTTVRQRDTYADENRKLKEILAANGISYDLSSGGYGKPNSYADSSVGGYSAGYIPGSSSSALTSPVAAPYPPTPTQGSHSLGPQQQRQPGLDYDQIGIDFVLTLERPCMDHMQFLMVRSQNADADADAEVQFSGHALLASCPPQSHLTAQPEEPYPHQLQEVPMPDLVKLLDLSGRLPLDGEITPVMAWASIRAHGRAGEFSARDLDAIKTVLGGKVRCHGFGAVLEEFELRDAINGVVALLA